MAPLEWGRCAAKDHVTYLLHKVTESLCVWTKEVRGRNASVKVELVRKNARGHDQNGLEHRAGEVST